MPTASEVAAAEAEGWARFIHWDEHHVPEVHDDTPPLERVVVRFFDPAADLDRLAHQWDVDLTVPSLDRLAAFASMLAEREASAWNAGDADIAMRAFEGRRFLVGDRLVHWAVPWLDAVGRCYPVHRDMAHADRDWLLDVGDTMRVAPSIGSGEGLTLPGEDSFGPTAMREPGPGWMRSIWSGGLVLMATLRSMGLDLEDLEFAEMRSDFLYFYEAAAGRWRTMASNHPGTAALWADLAERASRSARWIKGDSSTSR